MNLNIYLKTYHHTYSKKIYVSKKKNHFLKAFIKKIKYINKSFFLKKYNIYQYKKKHIL